MTIPNDKVAIAISGPGGPVVALTNGGGYAEYVAAMAGKLSEISAGRIVMKWLTISGSTLRPQPREAKAAIARSLRETVWPALGDGRILSARASAPCRSSKPLPAMPPWSSATITARSSF
ncbi:MAG: hypothetical protein Q8L54_13900 [Devosia sp.]|nr:hypothetical protein [Devosia sp.]